MDKKFTNRIKNAIRRLSWSWEPYTKVKNAAKVDKALHECCLCFKYCYGGKSEKNLTILKEKYKLKEVAMEKIYIDHIDPVESVEDGYVDLNTFAERLFCGEENLQPLCKTCHDAKSKEENAKRRTNKKRKTNG